MSNGLRRNGVILVFLIVVGMRPTTHRNTRHFMPATSGRGQLGQGTPHRVLVEWDLSADDHMVLADVVEGPGGGRVRRGVGEMFATVPEPPTAQRWHVYRVCAEGTGGRSCSEENSVPFRVDSGSFRRMSIERCIDALFRRAGASRAPAGAPHGRKATPTRQARGLWEHLAYSPRGDTRESGVCNTSPNRMPSPFPA